MDSLRLFCLCYNMLMIERDNHHLLFSDPQWSSTRLSKELRQEPSLQITIPRTNHEAIHAEVPHVPLLGPYALIAVHRAFEPSHNHRESIDSLLKAIEMAGKHPRAHEIERALAQLTIQAIELQIPFLELKRYH